MNKLSMEVKAKEVHENAQFWHNRAEHNLYRFFLEVKEIRDNRYYKELGFSTFEEYSEKQWNINRDSMYKNIKTASRLTEKDFVDYSLQFGQRKTLFLAEMDETQREQVTTQGVPTDEGYKSYGEATQKEITEYKRNAEEAKSKAEEYERQLQSAHEENDLLQSKLEDAENREPKVIEKYTEPEDYEEIKSVNKNLQEEKKRFAERNKNLQSKIDQLYAEMESADKNSKKYQELNEAIAKMQGRLTKGQEQIKAQKEVYELVKAGREAVVKISPLSYLVNSENIIDNDYARKPIVKLTEDLEEITQRLRKIINKEDIIGGR